MTLYLLPPLPAGQDDAVMDPRALPVPAPWTEPIRTWTDHLAASGLAATTVTTRRGHLERTASGLGLPPWEVTAEQLEAWLAGRSWARETRRSMQAAIRSFYDWGVDAGRCATSPACRLPRVKASAPHPRPAPEPVVKTALAAAPQRTRLILHLAAFAGMRRAEISQVHAADLVEDLDGWSLTVHGKGDKDRTVPLEHGLAVDVRAAGLAGGGWAFPGQDHGHLSPRYVGRLATDVLPGAWILDTLRQRFATAAFAGTHDLLAVQHFLGHASVATTQRYVAVRDDALRRAARAAA